MNPVIHDAVQKQRACFLSGKTKDLSFRKDMLRALAQIIRNSESKIIDALYDDMKKPEVEAYASEIAVVKHEISYVLSNIDYWTRTRKVHTPKQLLPSKSFIIPEPRGVALIISPWNYPFNLALMPLVSAIAAGNCSIIKPSEYSPHTSDLLDEIITSVFDPVFVRVINGDVEVARSILEERFDYIFFTGSTSTGRRVMEAGARFLTPMTLELGGKSPCIVDSDINVEYAARRIAWAKYFNAGQTCIAPDYLFVHKAIKKDLLEALGKNIRKFYGDNSMLNPDYARIINSNHFSRLVNLMAEGKIIIGGRTDEAGLSIEPTVIDDVNPEFRIMQEEIFGPILPVMGYKDIDQVIAFVNSRPKPLSLYVFSRDRKVQDMILSRTSSGGACVNDAMVQFESEELPFGGVGESGMGAYHGKAGFDAFTHYKSVVRNSLCFDLPFRYAPYRYKLSLARWLF